MNPSPKTVRSGRAASEQLAIADSLWVRALDPDLDPAPAQVAGRRGQARLRSRLRLRLRLRLRGKEGCLGRLTVLNFLRLVRDGWATGRSKGINEYTDSRSARVLL